MLPYIREAINAVFEKQQNLQDIEESKKIKNSLKRELYGLEEDKKTIIQLNKMEIESLEIMKREKLNLISKLDVKIKKYNLDYMKLEKKFMSLNESVIRLNKEIVYKKEVLEKTKHEIQILQPTLFSDGSEELKKHQAITNLSKVLRIAAYIKRAKMLPSRNNKINIPDELSEALPNYGSNWKDKYNKYTGKLVVKQDNWYIQFIFPGPDLRYNPTYFTIRSSQIQSYIDAYMDNWGTYRKLTEQLSKSSITSTGKNSMIINVGVYPDGVCIHYNYLPISSSEGIEMIISDFEWARKRAKELKTILFSL
jgi:hypothetical protein